MWGSNPQCFKVDRPHEHRFFTTFLVGPASLPAVRATTLWLFNHNCSFSCPFASDRFKFPAIPFCQLSYKRSIFTRGGICSYHRPMPVPMQDSCATRLFAFCGGVINDSTSRANRYGVSVGRNDNRSDCEMR